MLPGSTVSKISSDSTQDLILFLEKPLMRFIEPMAEKGIDLFIFGDNWYISGDVMKSEEDLDFDLVTDFGNRYNLERIIDSYTPRHYTGLMIPWSKNKENESIRLLRKSYYEPDNLPFSFRPLTYPEGYNMQLIRNHNPAKVKAFQSMNNTSLAVHSMVLKAESLFLNLNESLLLEGRITHIHLFYKLMKVPAILSYPNLTMNSRGTCLESEFIWCAYEDNKIKGILFEKIPPWEVDPGALTSEHKYVGWIHKTALDFAQK